MSQITVGLDFGTHQTKICIENASESNQKTYRFFEFNLNGEKSFFLPSIVQINHDNTVSYGVIDENRCLKKTAGFITDQIYFLKKSILIKPTLSKPETLSDSSKSKANESFNRQFIIAKRKERKLKKKLDKLGTPDINEVYPGRKVSNNTKSIENQKKPEHEIDYEIKLKEYNKTLQEYQKNVSSLYYLDIDDEGFIQSESMIFHHFKFAVFSDKVKWYHQISPEIISIWYLCNILFLLQKELGEEFFVQMGIPSGINHEYDKIQNEKGIKLLLSAYNLLDKFNNHSSFLKTDYISLLEKTHSVLQPDLAQQDFYGISTLPEAFASLSAVTQGGKLETGMSLLVDIGGGTTDIAFFTINDTKLPDIHLISSIYSGLNDIYQSIAIEENKPITKIQENALETGLSLKNYKDVQNDFSNIISKGVNNIIIELKKSFSEHFKDSKLDISKLAEALANRPVIYSGGGSTFQELRSRIGPFTDIKVLDNSLLRIPGLLNEKIDKTAFSILATSFGLSQAIENDLVLTPLSKLFAHIDVDKKSSASDYIHGLTDH